MCAVGGSRVFLRKGFQKTNMVFEGEGVGVAILRVWVRVRVWERVWVRVRVWVSVRV
jgi:hypothetical protein